jgi:integrase
VKEDDAEAAAKKITVSKATGEYLDEIKAHKSRKTFLAYSLTIKLFRHSCAKEQMQELDRKDVLAFMAHLRSEGNSPRTVANRVTYLRSFLLNQGVEWPLSKADRPRYAEKIVSAYSVGELQGLMAAADQNEYELFQFFLCTGARDQEVQYATWRDVDLQQKTFAVTEKLDLGFVPKDKEEGVVPIPDSLVNLLRARRQRQPKSRLIFPGPKGDKANEHYLRLLKQIALTAGLNCGHCYNKKGLCCDARSANLKLPLSK